MADLRVGSAVGGFRIESLIGQGSMGTVYSAQDAALDRRVAVKVLAPSLARDEHFRERFLRESRLAASLEHPNIIPIHAAGESEGVLYLAMRYVDGRDLASLLASLGRLDAERAVELVAQVGSALDAAHGRGLIHRDVKPANILVAHHSGRTDHAYLCDFGLAKHASTVSSLTGDRGIVGTVEYLAPEQIEGRPVDGRVDVYALGCVLYEMLTGEAPFRRGNELVALLAHVNDPPPKVSERRSDLPEAFDDVIAMALAKDRDLRYPNCQALVEGARAALRGERLGAPAEPVPEAAAVRTFLFADVRGYTAYTREHGDEAGAELARTFADIVSRLAPQHRGTLQELRGDEALVVFDSARAALRFALALQVAVAEEALARPVGVGLDAGEAVAVEGGFRGGALNRAARLCGLAGPREVLATDAVRELAGQTDGVVYGFRRVERLKGFERPVGVVEIHSTQAAPGRELGRSVRRRLLGTRPRRRVGAAIAVARRGGRGRRRRRLARTVLERVGFPGREPRHHRCGHREVRRLAEHRVERSRRTRRGRRRILGTLGLERVLPAADRPGAANGHAAGSARARPVRDGDARGLRGDLDDVERRRYAATDSLRHALRPDRGAHRSSAPGRCREQGRAGARDHAGCGLGRLRLAEEAGEDRSAHEQGHEDRRPARRRSLGRHAPRRGGRSAVGRSTATGGAIFRLDAESGEEVARGKIHGGFVEDAAVAGGSLWLAVENDGGVWQLDKAAAIVGKVETGQVPWALAVDGTDVYVSNQNSGTVTRIDALTRETRQFMVGHRPLALAVKADRLWVFVAQSAEEARARVTGSRVVEAVTPGDPFFLTDSAVLQRSRAARTPVRRRRASHGREGHGGRPPRALPERRRRPAGDLQRRTHLHLHGPAGVPVLATFRSARDRRQLEVLDRARACRPSTATSRRATAST